MQPLLLGNGHQPLNAMTTFVMEPRWAPEETKVEGLGERIGSGREDYEMKDGPTRTSRTRPSMPSIWTEYSSPWKACFRKWDYLRQG